MPKNRALVRLIKARVLGRQATIVVGILLGRLDSTFGEGAALRVLQLCYSI